MDFKLLSFPQLLAFDFNTLESSSNISNDIITLLSIYENHKLACDESNDYNNASLIYEKLMSLRKYDELRKKNLVEQEYINNKLAIDEECNNEVSKFNIAWDDAMNEYDHKTSELVNIMKERHQQELNDLQADLRVKNPLRPKFSGDLLNLRRVQASLAKQNNYAEAVRIQKQADSLEVIELQKLTAAWELKLSKQETLFRSKQFAELLALEKRVHTGQEEQNKVRNTEYERLLQRYSNLKLELERVHIKNRKMLQDVISDKIPLSARGRVSKKLETNKFNTTLNV